MDELTKKILFAIACLSLPIIWGVVVNWLFRCWQTRNSDESKDEPIFPDYQI